MVRSVAVAGLHVLDHDVREAVHVAGSPAGKTTVSERVYFNTACGVSDVQSTSSMLSSRTKCWRHVLMKFALTAQPTGP